MSRLKRLRKSLTQFPDIDPPSSWLFAAESRAIWEFWAGVSLYAPLKLMSKQGDGHPVLVLPGLGASDISTSLLRKFIDSLGYVSYAWELGRNRGFQDETHAALQGRLNVINNTHQQKVSIIGQSLGGVYARELAKSAPHQVRQVITLGSPFSGHPLASTGVRAYEWFTGEHMEDQDYDRYHAIRVKPPVPTTSVYSKLDGIVAWKCSIETGTDQAENIHLRGGSHCGMASNPAALYLLANRLSQQEEHWQPFEPKGAARALYGTEDHRAAFPP